MGFRITNAPSIFKSRGDVLLKVQPKSFTQHDQIPQGHWGPVPVAPRDLTAGGSIATHRYFIVLDENKISFMKSDVCLCIYNTTMFSYKISLLNYCGQTSYNVTLIHSAQARMSAAMVTNGANQLQAVAHLIGTDQLPIPESVSTTP